MRTIRVIIISFLLYAIAEISHAQFPDFTISDTGSIPQSTGHHVASGCFDMDNDGDLDLIITNSSGMGYTNHPNLIYRNERNNLYQQITNTPYTLEILEIGLPGPFGDIDNDGDVDLFAQNWGETSILFKNDGYGNFIKESDFDQIGGTSMLFDLNNDSYLDLLQFGWDSTLVYYNDGSGLFPEYANLNIFFPDPVWLPHHHAWGDADSDGDFDLYIGYTNMLADNVKAKNDFFLNQGGEIFERSCEDSIIVKDSAQTPNINWVDYDNDLDMDLYVLNSFNKPPFEGSLGVLFENLGELTFKEHVIEPEIYLNAQKVSSLWGDLDNDADLDLYITVERTDAPSGTVLHNLLFINNSDGTFTEMLAGTLFEESSHTALLEDFDNDGDLDVLLVRFSWANNGRNNLIKNEGNDNAWFILDCEGRYSNRSAFGTRVITKTQIDGNWVSQMREIRPMDGHATFPSTRVHFGLGTAESVDSLIILWPSGHIDTYLDIPARQFYQAIEDSVMNINFKATNYIEYFPAVQDTTMQTEEILSFNFAEHYQFVTGDTIPSNVEDFTFSIYNISKTEVINATIEGTMLTIRALDSENTVRVYIKADNGFTARVDQFLVRVKSPVQTVLSEEESGIIIYPNPFNEKFTIEFSIPFYGSIHLLNTIGQIMHSEEIFGTNLHTVLLNNIPPGIYIFMISNKESIIKKKILKLQD